MDRGHGQRTREHILYCSALTIPPSSWMLSQQMRLCAALTSFAVWRWSRPLPCLPLRRAPTARASRSTRCWARRLSLSALRQRATVPSLSRCDSLCRGFSCSVRLCLFLPVTSEKNKDRQVKERMTCKDCRQKVFAGEYCVIEPRTEFNEGDAKGACEVCV